IAVCVAVASDLFGRIHGGLRHLLCLVSFHSDSGDVCMHCGESPERVATARRRTQAAVRALWTADQDASHFCGHCNEKIIIMRRNNAPLLQFPLETASWFFEILSA